MTYNTSVKTHFKKPNFGFENGFMMIETLVAVIILAIGLIGMAGMQALALKNNNSALSRTQATYLTYDIMDRIRSNRDGDYSLAFGATPTSSACLFTASSPADLNCSADDLANYDKTLWLANIANSLPGGQGSVSRVVVDNIRGIYNYTITIRWLDKNAVTTSGQQLSLEMSTVI